MKKTLIVLACLSLVILEFFIVIPANAEIVKSESDLTLYELYHLSKKINPLFKPMIYLHYYMMYNFYIIRGWI